MRQRAISPSRHLSFVLPSSFGIRASSFLFRSQLLRRLNQPEQNRHWDRRIANEKRPGENSPAEREARCQFFIVEPKRLKKTRRAVTEMKREKEKAEEVKCRYIVVLKSVNHHRINVVMTKRIGFEQREARIGHAHGEMSEMIN